MSARSEARERGDLTYISDKPCPQGHQTERYVKYGQCRDCLNEMKRKGRAEGKYKESAENKAKWKEANRQRMRLRKYGLDEAAFEKLLKQQNNKCAVCEEPFSEVESEQRSRHIDHCHNSNKVRGILCMKCNLGLGYFRDRIDFLQNAIRYLGKSNNV